MSDSTFQARLQAIGTLSNTLRSGPRPMDTDHLAWGRRPLQLVGPRALVLLLAVLGLWSIGCQVANVAEIGHIRAQFSPAAVAPGGELTLAECLRLALVHQPRLATHRASLAAAEDSQRALKLLRFPANLDPQVPVRRQQACLGIAAATATVDEAEHEVRYAVTRGYFTVLYAREQERVTRGVIERLTATREITEEALKAGARDVTTVDVRRTTVYLQLAQTRHTQAAQGVQRALAALHEAIGLAPDTCFNVPGSRLPAVTLRPCQPEVVAAALARRGVVLQASLFAQLTLLEVEAQATSLQTRVPTFAAGGDIHARQVPQGQNNSEYRPGGVPPEMPTLLVGSRDERVQRAQSLSTRAAAGVETTRNLVALEASDAFLRWEEAEQQVRQARTAADEGAALAADLARDLAAGLKVRIEDVITTHVLAAQARSLYNEYLYRQILALADLERITAGGFHASLDQLADTASSADESRQTNAGQAVH